MMEITATLLTDGSSDRALIPILKWLIRQEAPNAAVNIQWADLRRRRAVPKALADRVRAAIQLYPSNMLFVHRDAEGEPRQRRLEEIDEALAAINAAEHSANVAVIPVRMTEVWLLLDEGAIRRAAGNPNGTMALDLPTGDLEAIPDPKALLHEFLRLASGLTGRRLNKFKVHRAVGLVAEFTDTFPGLRELPAFRCLEKDTKAALRRL